MLRNQLPYAMKTKVSSQLLSVVSSQWSVVRGQWSVMHSRLQHATRITHQSIWFAGLLLLTAGPLASAQTFSIDWFTIGGGGTSTGGVYSLTGTIGQADASPQPMTGGDLSLIGGFWPLFVAQPSGAPVLTVTLNSQLLTLTISWPSSPDFTLQQNSDVNTMGWVSTPETVFDDGTNKFIIVNPSASHRFYRLFQP